MVDKVKPLKIETTPDGNQTDYMPTEVNPAEDYAAFKGISFEDSDKEIMDLSPDVNVQCPSLASLVMSKSVVPEDAKSYIISTNHQYINFELVTVDGSLVIDGDWVIFE